MPSQDSQERARAWLVAEDKRAKPNGIGGYRWVLPESIPDEKLPECLPRAVFERLHSVPNSYPWNFPNAYLAFVAAIIATAEAIEANELDITK